MIGQPALANGTRFAMLADRAAARFTTFENTMIEAAIGLAGTGILVGSDRSIRSGIKPAVTLLVSFSLRIGEGARNV